jgi:hypothetical protein
MEFILQLFQSVDLFSQGMKKIFHSSEIIKNTFETLSMDKSKIVIGF